MDRWIRIWQQLTSGVWSGKKRSTVVSRSRINAPCYGDFTLGAAEVKTVYSCSDLIDSKSTFKTHLREVVSKAASSLGVVYRAGKLFDCLRVLKSCFKAQVLYSLEYCALKWMSPGSVIWVSWIVLFAVWEGCVRLNFVVLCTERISVPCICSIRFVTQRTTLCVSIVILALLLLWVSYLWRSQTGELLNSVGHFCLLLVVCETCCRSVCWALLRAPCTCGSRELSLTFFFLIISVYSCYSVACLASWLWGCSGS